MRPLKDLRAIIKTGGSVRLPGVGVVTTIEDLETHYDAVSEDLEAQRETLDARRQAVRLGRGGLVAPGTNQVQQMLSEKDAEIERLITEVAGLRGEDYAKGKEQYEARIRELTDDANGFYKDKQTAEKAATDLDKQVKELLTVRDDLQTSVAAEKKRAEEAEKRVKELEKEIEKLKKTQAASSAPSEGQNQQ